MFTEELEVYKETYYVDIGEKKAGVTILGP